MNERGKMLSEIGVAAARRMAERTRRKKKVDDDDEGQSERQTPNLAEPKKPDDQR